MDEIKKWDLQQLPGYEAIEEKESEATQEPKEFSGAKELILYKISNKELNKMNDEYPDDDRLVYMTKKDSEKSKRVHHKMKTSSYDKPKKVISKDSPQNYLAQGDDFKKLKKKAKKLGADSLQYSKRKNYKY